MMKREYNIKGISGKMHLFIGVPIGVIVVLSFLFVIIISRQNARKAAIDQTIELLKSNSAQLSNELNCAIAYSEALGASVDYVFNSNIPNRIDILKKSLLNQSTINSKYESIFVSFQLNKIDPEYTADYGRRTYQTFASSDEVLAIDKDLDGFDRKTLYYKLMQTGKADVRDPYYHTYANNGEEKFISTISAPIWLNGSFAGNAGVHLPVNVINEIVEKIHPFDEAFSAISTSTGSIIAQSIDKKAKNPKTYRSLQEIYPELITEKDNGILKKMRLNEPVGMFNKVNGIRCYSIFIPILVPNTDTMWIMSVAVPNSLLYAKSNKIVAYCFLVALLSIVLIVLIINFVAIRISNPLKSVAASISKLSEGDIGNYEEMELKTNDEIEEIAGSVNNLVKSLNQTASFAKEIGFGHLDAEYHLLSDKDLLGQALEEMRTNLVEFNHKEAERKGEDEKVNWAVKGTSIMAEVLRTNFNNIEELSFKVISTLVKYMNAMQGGLFLLNDSDDNHPTLDLKSCFAYNRKKTLEVELETNEGLVGQCFTEGEYVYITDLPSDYMRITSGLGDTNPGALLLVPLKVEEKINGVIEIASLKEFEEYEIKFVLKVAESIASTMNSSAINQHTAELLSQTQQQAEEMSAQEEEMRQNMEELQATQEEMNRLLDEQKEAQVHLSNEQVLFNNLLGNITDLIYYRDDECRFIKVSQSLLEKSGLPEEEFIDHTTNQCFDMSVFDEDKHVVRSGKSVLDIEETMDLKNGAEPISIRKSKIPLRNDEGKIVGMVGIIHERVDVGIK